MKKFLRITIIFAIIILSYVSCVYAAQIDESKIKLSESSITLRGIGDSMGIDVTLEEGLLHENVMVESSDDTVVNVVKGQYEEAYYYIPTAGGIGEATITFTIEDNDTAYVASCDVKVLNNILLTNPVGGWTNKDIALKIDIADYATHTTNTTQYAEIKVQPKTSKTESEWVKLEYILNEIFTYNITEPSTVTVRLLNMDLSSEEVTTIAENSIDVLNIEKTSPEIKTIDINTIEKDFTIAINVIDTDCGIKSYTLICSELELNITNTTGKYTIPGSDMKDGVEYTLTIIVEDNAGNKTEISRTIKFTTPSTDNTTDNSNTDNTPTTNVVSDNTTSDKDIPAAGSNSIIFIISFIAIISVAIVIFNKNRITKDI